MLLKTLKEHKKARFYSFVGASVKFDRKKIYSQKYMNSNEGDATYLDSYGKVKSTIKNDDLFYIGPGLGFDFMISEYVSLAIEWPLTVSSEKKIMMYSPQIALMIRY
ncbi:MAG: hypothetical protein B6226_04955 [Candidatus Cloacimonetes bacterium 4572_65]|nr:MAG: hypothetical protein B6226_04955 [Candidatus Cloacimonetes bacterium 4572_65]